MFNGKSEWMKVCRKNLEKLVIVYLGWDIITSKKRDQKGIYDTVVNGNIGTLIGFNSDYIPPINPHIVIINAETETHKKLGDRLISSLVAFGLSMWFLTIKNAIAIVSWYFIKYLNLCKNTTILELEVVKIVILYLTKHYISDIQ